jgi:hypothetical protein
VPVASSRAIEFHLEGKLKSLAVASGIVRNRCASATLVQLAFSVA